MSLDITHQQYRKFLRDTCWYAHAHERNAKELAYLTLGLVGEAGEFADAFKKLIREIGFDDLGRLNRALMQEEGAKMTAELGDVLWYITRLCDVLGIGLEDLMLMNTYKLFKRIEDGGWSPPMRIDWPYSDPFKSYKNVQQELFPADEEQ